GEAGRIAAHQAEDRFAARLRGDEKQVGGRREGDERHRTRESHGARVERGARRRVVTLARNGGRRHDQLARERGAGGLRRVRRRGGGPDRGRPLAQRRHDDLPAGLLERQRKVEQSEAEAILRLVDQRRQPARLDHRGPRGPVDLAADVAQLARPARAGLGAEPPRRIAQQKLFLVEQKFHCDHDGRSSTRLAMMLRWISTVPPPTVPRRISNRSAAGFTAALPTMMSAALAPSGPAASTSSSEACWPSSPPAILITGAIASGALPCACRLAAWR